MKKLPAPLDLKKVKVLPLEQRRSLSVLDAILVDPAKPPPACPPETLAQIQACAKEILKAQERGARVVLMYGGHLVKNGALSIVNELVNRGLVTHLATNGAGVIHDWELAFLGRTEELVRENIPTGTFGAWDETGRYTHLALMMGALRGEGYGQSMGRFIEEDGTVLPDKGTLEKEIREAPSHPVTPARAELLRAMVSNKLRSGHVNVPHPHKETSIIANAFRRGVPFTVHPGIGYDIIATHPLFRGAVIGRAADIDFRVFGGSLEQLDGGVVLSIGTAVMGPMVFEKAINCVNNLRLQAEKPIVHDHTIHVVDLQDGGNWDWTKGEPPKNSPAYYLRFCKSYARMGGTMRYHQSDNVVFLHNLLHEINQLGS